MPRAESPAVDANAEVMPCTRGARTFGRCRPWRLDLDAERGGQLDGRAGRGVVEGSEPVPAAAVQEPDELRASAAGARRLNSGELAPDLARKEH